MEAMTIEARRPMFTAKTLAAYLAVSERKVRMMFATGEIPSFFVGGSRRATAEAVDAYLAGCQNDGDK